MKKPAPQPQQPRKSRSGTSRTYSQRMQGGRPNMTFSLPIETVELLERLAERFNMSKSGVVDLAILELAKRR